LEDAVAEGDRDGFFTAEQVLEEGRATIKKAQRSMG